MCTLHLVKLGKAIAPKKQISFGNCPRKASPQPCFDQQDVIFQGEGQKHFLKGFVMGINSLNPCFIC